MNIESSEVPATSLRLFELIKERIFSGELTPGSKITEKEMADFYDVNRAPVREAFLRLEERRLIERVPYSGTRVFRPSARMVEELFEIREALEVLAVGKAIRRITDEQAEAFCRRAQESHARLSAMDDAQTRSLPPLREFHLLIAEMSQNHELLRLLKSEVWNFIKINYRIVPKAREKKLRGSLDHIAIADAIHERDIELSQLLIRRHIQFSYTSWKAAHEAAHSGR